ncbi:MAG: hypothetical protein LC800_02285 [Acidobacteria bacterium]|nr:hypothetical protein [Acidobacteriota bacterium]
MAALSLYPQVRLWRERGAEWNGEYALFYSDEPFYAAYVNALRAGRPRRNDAYSGRDRAGAGPLPESILSAQFVAGYAVALPARLFGLSTATAFILLAPLVAFLSSLALYRLVLRLTGDAWVAAASVPFVLCLGALVNFQGAIRTLTGTPPIYTYLPFLRRYVPGAAFPLLFVFCACVWRALAAVRRRGAISWALAAGACVALLVYSYFYLWTAALAWLAVIGLLWSLARREESRRVLEVSAVTLATSAAALVPYFRLLSRRAADTDAVQALAHTRAPDLLRRPELAGFLLLALLAAAWWRGRVRFSSRVTLFAAAFALTPSVLYNQQILTGRSLQPFHYDLFAANYFVLLSAALAAWLLWRGPRAGWERASASGRVRLLLACVALAAFGWGFVESEVDADRLAPLNRGRDEARAAALRVAELASADVSAPGRSDARPGAPADARPASGGRPVVLWTDLSHANELPGVAADAAVLWAIHMYSNAGVPLAENKERLFTHLYYTGVTPDRFAALAENDLPFRHDLFGWERVNRRLNANFRPVTPAETRAEIDAYASFVSTFARERAARLPLSYLVAPAAASPDLSNLARFYSLDAAERAGPFVIHRLRLRDGG